jgi:hypothetical protein
LQQLTKLQMLQPPFWRELGGMPEACLQLGDSHDGVCKQGRDLQYLGSEQFYLIEANLYSGDVSSVHQNMLILRQIAAGP